MYSEELFNESKKYFPGGVNSPVRAFKPYPFFVKSAGGSKLTDADGQTYIDYCLAQTISLQFWIASMADRADAWKRYLAFTDQGGTRTFEELVRGAGLKVPYDDGCIKEIGAAIGKWIEENPL